MVEALSEQNSPDWLGLPNNAEQVLLASVAHNLVINLLKMHQLDEELAYSYGEAKGKLEWASTQVLAASDLDKHTSVPWPDAVKATLDEWLVEG